MKIAVCGDVHFCKNSSIIKGKGKLFSIRLENCINSVNWFEKIAKQHNCDLEVFLGDFFDTATLDDETITAVKSIAWNDIPKKAIVGNHESTRADLSTSSLKFLEAGGFQIISSPVQQVVEDTALCFLPYTLTENKQPLETYFGERGSNYTKRILFSHNDLMGIWLGPVMSKFGFTPEELTNFADLVLNGHLHNGGMITDTLINLGNLTGKDFGENAFKYSHQVAIIDTATGKCELIENPYAFNFYKFEITTEADLVILHSLKPNAVVSIKCVEELVKALQATLEPIQNNFAGTRIITVRNAVGASECRLDAADLMVDHLVRFVQCCRDNIPASELFEQELSEICK